MRGAGWWIVWMAVWFASGCASFTIVGTDTADTAPSGGGVPSDGSSGDGTPVESDTVAPEPVDTAPCVPTPDCGNPNRLVPDVCVPNRVFECSAARQTPCSQASCGGIPYVCTNEGGVWAWRLGTACDDGDACTFDDACRSGTCRGFDVPCAPSQCTAVACDGTSSCLETPLTGTPCDDGDPCTHGDTCSAGVCGGTPVTCTGDACTQRTCNGTATCTEVFLDGQPCGDGNACTFGETCAAGTCGGGTAYTCGGGSACSASSCDGLGGCLDIPNDGATCNDGNACTFADTCGGGSCAGTGLSCVSSTCVERTCNGTAACTETPRNVGGSCNDGNACTVGETCSAGGTCGGGASAAVCGDGQCTCGETFASCSADCAVPLPSNACPTGSQSRDRCSNARVIGRQAARSGWSSGEQNTCNASDRFDGECGGLFDVGFDHAYTIYVLAGERVTVELGTTTRRCTSGEEFHSRLKFKFNASTATSGASSCPTHLQCWGGPTRSSSTTTIRTFDATEDGWLYVVVDGGATAFDEHRGYYTLDVDLSRCATPDCGC